MSDGSMVLRRDQNTEASRPIDALRAWWDDTLPHVQEAAAKVVVDTSKKIGFDKCLGFDVMTEVKKLSPAQRPASPRRISASLSEMEQMPKLVLESAAPEQPPPEAPTPSRRTGRGAWTLGRAELLLALLVLWLQPVELPTALFLLLLPLALVAPRPLFGFAARSASGREAGAAPAPAASTTAHGGLKASAQAMRGCLLGADDVDVPALMAACEDWVLVCRVMGGFTKQPAEQGCRPNIAKVRSSPAYEPEQRSMAALLDAERRHGMHRPGGLLADPSAAMGLLWIRRALVWWVGFLGALGCPGAGGRRWRETGGGAAAAAAAFEDSHAPWTGVAVRNVFKLTIAIVPDWSVLAPLLGPTHEEVAADMRAWAAAADEVTRRMRALLEARDLWDVRRSWL